MRTKLTHNLVIAVSVYAPWDASSALCCNTIVINPAYAGSRELQICLHYIEHGFGLEGAPTTNAVSVNMAVDGTNRDEPLNCNDKIGPSE
jgi:hypothetical protein